MFKDLCSSHQSICVDLSWQFYTYLCVYINKIQQAATVCRCLFTAKLLYMFRVSLAPIIRSTSNCNCAYGTGHSVRATTFRQRGLIRPCWRKVVALTPWSVPEAQLQIEIRPRWRKVVALTLWPVPEAQLHFDILLMMGAIDTRNM